MTMAEGGIPALLAEEKIELTHKEQPEMDAFEALLQKRKSERMQELEQIQAESKPVTGKNYAEDIDSFFAKKIDAQEHVKAAQASGIENVPLNSRDTEEHRPEAVVIEIQGLSQQQRVSSVLQTAGFRRHLETIIRGSISTVTRNHSPVSSFTNSPASSHLPSPSPAQRASPVRDTQTVPVPLIAGPEIRNDRANSVSSRESSSSSSTNSSVNYTARIQDPRGLLGSVATAPPAPPVPGQVPLVNNVEVATHVMEEMHRDDLIHEVSELVHRRLVSDALEGEFRNVLEFHIGDRLRATGTDGERVQEFVRSIPQSQPHIQNDFSNLGLPAPNENWDNISVTSISATAVPYTQTNLHMSREIASLKAQMQEMRNMMKVSFDLQLDIQRAIRQEVAAGIAAAATGSNQTVDGETAAPKTKLKSQPANDTHCLICLDNFSDSVLYQCGHMCVCYPCGRRLMDREAKCPVCRAPIRDLIRVYKCNED